MAILDPGAASVGSIYALTALAKLLADKGVITPEELEAELASLYRRLAASGNPQAGLILDVWRQMWPGLRI